MHDAEAYFIDTGYFIALMSPADRYHALAADIAKQLKDGRSHLVTTRAVILEIGGALARLRYRKAAVTFIAELEKAPFVDIVSLTDELFNQAFQLFSTRQDKEWSLTDCLSFVVMHERGINKALSTDAHYAQAGFAPMLLTAAAT